MTGSAHATTRYRQRLTSLLRACGAVLAGGLLLSGLLAAPLADPGASAMASAGKPGGRAPPAPRKGRASAPTRADRSLVGALRAHIITLASAEYGGREPGTAGETRTLKYLAGQWFDYGLESGTNDPANEWFAPVDVVARRPSGMRASFMRGRKKLSGEAEDAFVVTSGLRSLADNAPVVFVGDGTGAVPARQDLAGRVALMLDRLPQGADPDRFEDRQGRLLDGGAAAVVTVLDGDETLTDLRARRGQASYGLAGQRLGGDIEAYVSPAYAEKLLAGGPEGGLAGLQKLAAQKPASGAFAPVALGLTATLEATSRESRIHTHNLIGRLPGRNPAAGAVILSAHWDHFGTCGDEAAKDRICNGAVDNASGLATITEAARLLSRGRQNERDIYFLATTGEELGLLGARAFVDNPPVPLRRIVAVLNVDSNAIAPAGTPFAILGKGRTPLDAQVEAVAKRTRRKLVDAPADAEALVERQDGWAFLQHDVPAVMVSTAFADSARLNTYMDTRYHRPSDKATGDIELGGAADDVAMLVDLARQLADPAAFPARAAGK